VSGGVVGAARRRFGDRPASFLLATPIVLVIAALDAVVAGLSSASRTFADDFSSLRTHRKQLRATRPENTEGTGSR
jgi:hypothetical protein